MANEGIVKDIALDAVMERWRHFWRLLAEMHPSLQPVQILDHGRIQLLDVMGSDDDIYRAAKASFGNYFADFEPTDMRKTLRYMMRHGHTSPFEQAEVKFIVKCPIFVHRQWIRHRTANVNEISGRYAELPEEFFIPERWRAQSRSNKQGSEGTANHDQMLFDNGESGEEPYSAEEVAFREYHLRLENGVSRELARTCLPLSTYTEMVWKCDLHNIMGFLFQRCDSHAQEEIRVYAEAMYELLEPLFPITFEAFRDYRLDAVTLSRQEQQALARLFPDPKFMRPDKMPLDDILQGREVGEFIAKLERIAGSRL